MSQTLPKGFQIVPPDTNLPPAAKTAPKAPIPIQAPSNLPQGFQIVTPPAGVQGGGSAPAPVPAPGGPLPWSDVPLSAVNHIGSSAYNTLVAPILHPIQTAESLYDLGKGAGSKVAGWVGVPQDPAQKAQDEGTVNAVGKFYADRYGSVEGFKQALATDPVGVMSDLASLGMGGEAVLGKVPGAAAQGAAKAAGMVGRLDPALNAAKLASGIGGVVGRGVGKLGSLVTSTRTGAGTETYPLLVKAGEQGGQAQQTALDAMRGNSPVDLAVTMAKSGVKQLQSDRNSAYRQAMNNLPQDMTHLSWAPIDFAIRDALDKVTYRGMVKDPEAMRAIQEMQQKVMQWKNAPYVVVNRPDPKTGKMVPTLFQYESTPHGMDQLKQALNVIQQRYEGSFTNPSRASKVVGNVVGAVRDNIINNVPSYAKTMQDYSEASNELSQIGQAFRLNGKNDDAALRNLQSTMRNNAYTNYGERTKLMNVLAQYEPNLPYQLAGQEVSTWRPRGLAGIVGATELGQGIVGLLSGHPGVAAAAIPTLALMSPRVMGETAVKIGAAKRMLRKIPTPAALGPIYEQSGRIGGLLNGGSGN